jgi:hypothetical protein
MHPVAIAGDQPATNGVSRSTEPIKLSFKHPIGVVERDPP